MTQINPYRKHEAQIKFLVHLALKQQLATLARERNISLSALMRLMASDYVKRHQTP